ncbi:MAG: HDOD domain-containing protein [Oligoflexia bacterium]|nr:HDOD domain-containing protein [Oligoflexia bacterium]
MSTGAANTGNDQGVATLTPDEFVEKLRGALRRDGDFPASAKIVSELRMLTSDPRTAANQVTEVILKEPSLGTRVLHLVNSSFYRRAKPIMTVSQAVIQIGMKPLADLCAGLVLLQKFVPLARRGGAFANCLQKTVLTSLLSSSLSSQSKAGPAGTKSDECGYLAGSFAELGTLLLAFYFPQVYETAVKRAESKRVSIEQGITEIVGLNPLELSCEVLKALELPDFYREIIAAARGKSESVANGALPTEQNEIRRIARSVEASRSISSVIVSGRSKAELDKALEVAKEQLALPSRAVEQIVGELPQVFKKQCECIELSLPSLPAYVAAYLDAPSATPTKSQAPSDADQFMQYVEEIRQAVESGESTASVITTVMETLAWNLKFERVLLLLVNPSKRRLVGRMLLGKGDGIDAQKVERTLDSGSQAPDAAALRESRPIFHGDPVLPEGWPFVAIPVGFAQRAIGVIYADRLPPNDIELSAREQAAISVLAELLDRSVSMST